jgi:hypothetical protein
MSRNQKLKTGTRGMTGFPGSDPIMLAELQLMGNAWMTDTPVPRTGRAKSGNIAGTDQALDWQ